MTDPHAELRRKITAAANRRLVVRFEVVEGDG